jgi:hypothetical protein
MVLYLPALLGSDAICYVSKLHTDSTSAAQHKTHGKREADRWKDGRSEMKEEESKKLSNPFIIIGC